MICGCEDNEKAEYENDDTRYLNILMTQEVDSTTIDTLFTTVLTIKRITRENFSRACYQNPFEDNCFYPLTVHQQIHQQ